MIVVVGMVVDGMVGYLVYSCKWYEEVILLILEEVVQNVGCLKDVCVIYFYFIIVIYLDWDKVIVDVKWQIGFFFSVEQYYLIFDIYGVWDVGKVCCVYLVMYDFNVMGECIFDDLVD